MPRKYVLHRYSKLKYARVIKDPIWGGLLGLYGIITREGAGTGNYLFTSRGSTHNMDENELEIVSKEEFEAAEVIDD